jgi:hypothetical protein
MDKRPVSPQVFAILRLIRGYPDARNHQIAAYLGVSARQVSRVREEYGLQRRSHPPLVGKRPVPKQFADRWRAHRVG